MVCRLRPASGSHLFLFQGLVGEDLQFGEDFFEALRVAADQNEDFGVVELVVVRVERVREDQFEGLDFFDFFENIRNEEDERVETGVQPEVLDFALGDEAVAGVEELLCDVRLE